MADNQWLATQALTAIQERPVGGDFQKYGPRGTGEFNFQLMAYVDEAHLRGVLLESWDVSPKS